MADSHAHAHGAPDHDMTTAPAEVAHGSARTYVIVGIILTLITAVEVVIFYIKALEGILIPLLIVLSVVKFVTVVQFFMHLRYDNKVLSRVFFGPLFLAVLVVVGMIMLFKWLPKFAW